MNRGAETEKETCRSPVSSQSKAAEQRNRTKIIHVVYLIAALDITWMFLQFSVTPYLAKKLGFDTLWVGYLQTMVGVMQLFGGPMFGRFGDLFGARLALSLACSATVVFFLLLAIADHPAMLFIHKLPTVFMHVLPASQMVVADLSEPEKRADALSKLGLCFGVGMVVGSTLGGHLNTRYGETFTACFGAAGSAFSLLLVLKFIPKTTKAEVPKTNTDDPPRKMERFPKVMHCKNQLSVFGKKIGVPERDPRRELRQREAMLRTQKEMLKEGKSCRAIGDQMRKKLLMMQQKSGASRTRKPGRAASLSKIESLEKELLSQTEELKKTQKRCEELKQSLTQVAVQFQQCRATVREQKEKLKAVTAERNVHRTVAEKLRVELADIKKKQRIEKLRKNVARMTAKVKQSSRLPPPASLMKTGDKLKYSHCLLVPVYNVMKYENKSKSIFSVGEITRLMKFPGVTPTFLVKIIASLPSGIFQVMFSIIALDFFKLQPEENGYLMAYFGIASMVIQGGVIGRLTARYSENSLLLLSIGVSSFVGLAQAYMQNVFQFCFTVVPMMFSLSMFNVITDSMLTKSVPSSDTGTMMGLCSSVQSLLRTVGPTLGGFLYVNYGISSIGLIQFFVNMAVFMYLLQRRLNKTPKLKE
ncbi:hypothetical protein L3Q82_008550 [Scortum barcoo]|uniref:Uncharacterized protein n=1 Tax=Scortum barcoo TaxID=214431 RepID=A0ACB8XB40_9TELE|nr:hypothetical protein L3Q82_008550 [Scortum barcoo]